MVGPRVAAEPPAGWGPSNVEPPPIAEGTGARLVGWKAWGAEDAALVLGCVATPIPGWVEDMRPAVEGRTVALAGAAAARIMGGPVDARPGDDGVLALRAASDLGGPVLGNAKTFVGFDESRVFTCFAACAARGGTERRGTHLPCERSVVEARLDGSGSAPAPGLALRGATWAVHHPAPVAAGGVGGLIVLGVLAVALRRRPRSSMASKRARGPA